MGERPKSSCDSSDENTGKSAVFVDAPAYQRYDQQWTKRGAKTRPSVEDKSVDGADAKACDDVGKNCDRDDKTAGDEHDLFR